MPGKINTFILHSLNRNFVSLNKILSFEKTQINLVFFTYSFVSLIIIEDTLVRKNSN